MTRFLKIIKKFQAGYYFFGSIIFALCIALLPYSLVVSMIIGFLSCVFGLFFIPYVCKKRIRENPKEHLLTILPISLSLCGIVYFLEAALFPWFWNLTAACIWSTLIDFLWEFCKKSLKPSTHSQKGTDTQL